MTIISSINPEANKLRTTSNYQVILSLGEKIDKARNEKNAEKGLFGGAANAQITNWKKLKTSKWDYKNFQEGVK